MPDAMISPAGIAVPALPPLIVDGAEAMQGFAPPDFAALIGGGEGVGGAVPVSGPSVPMQATPIASAPLTAPAMQEAAVAPAALATNAAAVLPVGARMTDPAPVEEGRKEEASQEPDGDREPPAPAPAPAALVVPVAVAPQQPAISPVAPQPAPPIIEVEKVEVTAHESAPNKQAGAAHHRAEAPAPVPVQGHAQAAPSPLSPQPQPEQSTAREDGAAPASLPALMPDHPAAPAPAPHRTEASAVISAAPGRFGEELGIAIARHMGRGEDAGHETLTLRLDPPEHGRIEVTLSFEDGGPLRAVVAASQSGTLDLLRRDSADLSRALAQAGVGMDAQSFTFSAQTQSGGGERGRQGMLPGPQPGFAALEPEGGEIAPPPPDYRRLRTSGSLNLIA